MRKLTWQIIDVDNVVNWVLGVSLVLVPDFFNKILFGHEFISHWIYIVLGLGSLWFAVWQVDNFIKPRELVVPALRLAAILAWVPALLLLGVLLSSLSQALTLGGAILLWLSLGVMIGLGGWYWYLSRRMMEQV